MLIKGNGLLIGGAGVAVVVTALATGWYTTSIRLDAAQKDAKSLRSDLKSEREAYERTAAIATEYERRLKDAREKIENQRATIDRGDAELRLNATCDLPENAGTASEHNAATARPTDSAERDYWRLRERIEQITEQNLALQEYAKACAERFKRR